MYNEAISLYDKLALEMQTGQWNSITLCSAFLTKDASQSLIKLFSEIETERKLKITIIIGVKNYFTVPDAIEILLDYINNNEENNFEFNLRLPRDTDFHMKCYVFLRHNVGKAIVGSANLTNTGLDSNGELMIETNDENTVNSVVKYVDHYLNESEDWNYYINKYANIYEKVKPQIAKINKTELFKNKKMKSKIKRKLTIRFTAPTMGILGKANNEQEERVKVVFGKIKNQFPDINKSNWITYSEQTTDDIYIIKEEYPIGSCFDRPRDNYSDWEIGSNRMICNVGAIASTLDDEIVMFMKKGCIHYTVNEEIVEIAEELGIKSYDKNYIPTREEIDKYKKFILDNRNK